MQGLISNLIRPYRFRYSIFDLGPKHRQKYERFDGNVLNQRGLQIQYSYYKNKNISDICLIYAHCNSGCRVQGLQFVTPTIDQGWNLCLFDFAGSGVSQGQYISLGYYQSKDLQTMISLVLREGNKKINLWGRSMGAATIILYLQKHQHMEQIISCVLDSPYCSLWKVIKQYGNSKIKIPQFIAEHLMEFIRKNIIKNHKFDIKQLQLSKKIQYIQIPMMFITSTLDSFVNFNHATQLYKWANSKKKILQYIQKQHNSPRDGTTIQLGLNFMNKNLNQKLISINKKKYQCSNINGYNMAQLITKSPIVRVSRNNRKYVKEQTPNTKISNFFSLTPKNKQKLQYRTQHSSTNIEELKIQTQRHKQNKSNIHQHKNKTQHTLQKSIIQLQLPPQHFITQPTASPQHKIQYPQPQKPKYKSHLITNHKPQPNPSIHNQKCNQQINTNEYLNNINISINKQNNLNITNKCNPKIDQYRYYSLSFDTGINNSTTLNGIKNQYIQQDISWKHNQSINQNNTNNSQKNTYINTLTRNSIGQSTTTNKQNGIKLFTKIANMVHKNNNNNQYKQQQLNRNTNKSKTRNRIKTQIIHTKNKQLSSTQQHYFINKYITKDNIYIDNTHINTSYSDLSNDAPPPPKQPQHHPLKIQPLNLTTSHPNKPQPQNSHQPLNQQSNKYIGCSFRECIRTSINNNQDGVNNQDTWRSSNLDGDGKIKEGKDYGGKDKHFISIGNQIQDQEICVSFGNNCSQINNTKNRKNIIDHVEIDEKRSETLSKTQKILKLQKSKQHRKHYNINTNQLKVKPSIKGLNLLICSQLTKKQKQQYNKNENKSIIKNDRNSINTYGCSSRLGNKYTQINLGPSKFKNCQHQKIIKINHCEGNYQYFS